MTRICLAQSYGPNWPNDSGNVIIYISTNITGNYDITVPNITKIIEQENVIIKKFK